MPKKTYVKVNGTWRNVKVAWLNVSGVWRKLTPKGNINGVWKEFIHYMLSLYSYGNEEITVTGGWIEGYKDTSYVSQSKNPDNLYLSSMLNKDNGWVTKNRIDVTNFKTITVTIMGNKENNTGHISLLNNQMDSYSQAIADKSMLVNANKVSFSLDISNLSGEYYVSASKNGYGPYYIYDVILS